MEKAYPHKVLVEESGLTRQNGVSWSEALQDLKDVREWAIEGRVPQQGSEDLDGVVLPHLGTKGEQSFLSMAKKDPRGAVLPPLGNWLAGMASGCEVLVRRW